MEPKPKPCDHEMWLEPPLVEGSQTPVMRSTYGFAPVVREGVPAVVCASCLEPIE